MSKYDNIILADNPTRYWKCDDAAGPVCVDAMGNGNAAYVENILYHQIPVILSGNSVKLLGTDTYSEITVGLTVAESGFTFEMWINSDDTNIGDMRLSNWDTSNFISRIDNTMFQPYLNSFGGFQNTSAYLSNNTPYLITFTVTPEYLCTWYVNGVQVYQNTDNSVTVNTLTNIGGLYGGTYGIRLTNTRVDNVAYYPSVLTPTRIMAHYTAGITPEPIIPHPFPSFYQIP